MKKIKAENGGYYTTYASGDGAMRFTHTNINGQATSEQVPIDIAINLVPEGYTTLYLSGQLLAIHPVFRVSSNVLLRGGDNTKYLYWYDEKEGYSLTTANFIKHAREV